MSAIATATSTALDAPIATIRVSGDVATARIASAATASGRERRTRPTASPRKMACATRNSAGRRTGDRELVADGDGDQREHDDLEVPSTGVTEADVTEGSGGVWERLLRLVRSRPGRPHDHRLESVGGDSGHTYLHAQP